MPFIIGGALVGSALIGGVASAMSASEQAEAVSEQNVSNVNLNLANRQFNAEQADINRQFQQGMAGSAYQRAVSDMKAAGLNPMLAYSQGGAAMPGGSLASSSAATVDPVVDNAGGAGLGGALAAASKSVELQSVVQGMKQSKAQEELLRAQVPRQMAETHLSESSARQIDARLEKEFPLDIDVKRESAIRARQRHDAYERSSIASALGEGKEKGDFGTRQLAGELVSLEAGADLKDIEEREARLGLSDRLKMLAAAREHEELGLSRSRAESEFYKGLGKYRPYVVGAGEIFNSAARARRSLGGFLGGR